MFEAGIENNRFPVHDTIQDCVKDDFHYDEFALMLKVVRVFLNKSSLPSIHPHKITKYSIMEFRSNRKSARRLSTESLSCPYFTNSSASGSVSKRDLTTKVEDDISIGKISKKSRSNTFSSSITSEGNSPFARKTVLQTLEDYSDQVVVKEVEKKQQNMKRQPSLGDIQASGDENPKINEKIDLNQFVFFDLETGGLSAQKADILEIAASTSDGITFSTYVKPVKKINPFASKVNHITYRDGNLSFRGKVVQSLSITDALSVFLDWLKQVGNGKKVVLVAHNSNFDSRFLVHYLLDEGLESLFLKIVLGFLDTIPMFKKIHPGLSGYKQDFLVSKFITKNKDYDAHSATSDVKYLKDLFLNQLATSITDFSEFSYTSSHALKKQLLGPKVKVNITTYKSLIRYKVMSTAIATKLSALNYRYDELVAVYQTKGPDGLKTIFTQPDSKGTPQITASDIVISKIIAHFDKKYSKKR